MRPILFHITQSYFVHSGHFMLFLGGLAGLSLFRMEMKRTGEEPDKMYLLLLLLFVATISGGRLLYWMDFSGTVQTGVLDVLKFWKGGMSLQGGGILAFVTFLVYVNWQRLDIWRIGDMIAPAAMVFVFFARIGCFLTGCCYGKEWGPDLPFAVTFTNSSSPAPKNIPLYPTQLLFAAAGLVVFAILWWGRKRKSFDGEIALVGVFLVSLFSLFIEFLRGDLRILYEVYGATFSQNQIINAGACLVCACLYFYRRKQWRSVQAGPG